MKPSLPYQERDVYLGDHIHRYHPPENLKFFLNYSRGTRGAVPPVLTAKEREKCWEYARNQLIMPFGVLVASVMGIVFYRRIPFLKETNLLTRLALSWVLLYVTAQTFRESKLKTQKYLTSLYKTPQKYKAFRKYMNTGDILAVNQQVGLEEV